jgi:hypothetical protein
MMMACRIIQKQENITVLLCYPYIKCCNPFLCDMSFTLFFVKTSLQEGDLYVSILKTII